MAPLGVEEFPLNSAVPIGQLYRQMLSMPRRLRYPDQLHYLNLNQMPTFDKLPEVVFQPLKVRSAPTIRSITTAALAVTVVIAVALRSSAFATLMVPGATSKILLAEHS